MKTPRLLHSIVLAALLLAPARLRADAQAIANLQFLNLQIIPAAGILVFSGASDLGFADLSAFAEANNSLGETVQDFAAATLGTVAANAAVTHATAHGEASALGTGGAAGNSTIPGSVDLHADTTGRGNYSALFHITGGTGPVNVDFSAVLSGLVSVLTDSYGIASAEAIFSLQVDGDPVLFFQSQHSIGNSDSVSDPIAAALADTRTLTYGTSYQLVIEADAETSATTTAVPEPSAFLMLLTPICYACSKRHRPKCHSV